MIPGSLVWTTSFSSTQPELCWVKLAWRTYLPASPTAVSVHCSKLLILPKLIHP